MTPGFGRRFTDFLKQLGEGMGKSNPPLSLDWANTKVCRLRKSGGDVPPTLGSMPGQ